MHLKKTRVAMQKGLLLAILCDPGFGLHRSYAQSIIPPLSAGPVSLTLPQAVTLALRQNRSIKLAHLSLNDSRHRKEIARSSYLPEIKNESSLLHITELAGIDIPAGAFGDPTVTGPIPPKSLFIGQGSHTSYTSGTVLTQPITQLFKIHEANRAATADVKNAEVQVNQAELTIAFQVRQLFYGILIAQLRQQAATAEISAANTKNKETEDAVTLGRALDVAALESRAAMLEAQQAGLTQRLQIHDLTLALNDLLGLPLESQLNLDESPSSLSPSIPTREECQRIAEQQSTQIRSAQQAVFKARAGLAAAKDTYIPNVTGLARYSYQSGVPLLVHNFGTFGLNFTYDLFDGGRRDAEIRDSRTLLSEAEISLAQATDEVTVAVATAYDKVEQLQNMVGVAQQALDVRTEAARLADRQVEQTAALASAREQAHAKVSYAKAALLDATLGLSLAQADLEQKIGQLPQ